MVWVLLYFYINNLGIILNDEEMFFLYQMKLFLETALLCVYENELPFVSIVVM